MSADLVSRFLRAEDCRDRCLLEIGSVEFGTEESSADPSIVREFIGFARVHLTGCGHRNLLRDNAKIIK